MPEIKDLVIDVQKEVKQLRDKYEDELKAAKGDVESVASEFKGFEEKINKHIDELVEQVKAGNEAKEQMKALEEALEAEKNRVDEFEKKFNRPGFATGEKTEEDEKKAFALKTYEKYCRFGWKGGNFSPEEQKALAEMSDDLGGYLVPEQFESQMIKVTADAAEVRAVCAPKPTGRDQVSLPKLTSRTSISWGTENVAVSDQDLAFGLETMPINEMTALTLVPNSLLEDAEVNLIAELAEIFGEDMAEAEDDAFIVGTGTKRPEGIMVDAGVLANYKAGGHASALNSGDALITAMQSLKKKYRKNGVWAMNSATEGAIRKLKSGDGQYLWQMSLAEGNPTSILGKPIINPEGMADIGAGEYPIVIGDFRRGYAIRDRRGIIIKRLDERYAEYRQTGFLITKRVGGQVVLSEAFVPIKIATS